MSPMPIRPTTKLSMPAGVGSVSSVISPANAVADADEHRSHPGMWPISFVLCLATRGNLGLVV
jgi:hypothetical protein